MMEMVQSRPAKKKLWKMDDGTTIESESYEQALKIFNSKKCKK